MGRKGASYRIGMQTQIVRKRERKKERGRERE
jgi:hypothetical protein